MEDKYMCTSESKMMLCSQEVKAGNNNNNNCDNVYGAIIMTKVIASVETPLERLPYLL